MASDLFQPTALRAHYDKAFEGFSRHLSTRSDEPRLVRLRELTSFRERVNWGQSGSDRAIRAIEEGINHGAWFVALSPDDPTAKTQGGIFATDWISESIVATCIRPDPITQEWAALGMVKSLEHLEGGVSGREPRFRTDWQHRAEDIRSYEVELLAADVLTQDRFGQEIANVLAAKRLRDGKEVLAFSRTTKVWPALDQLNPAVTASPSLSLGEEAMRGGLCLIALGFHAVEGFATDPESEFEQKIRFVEKLVPPPPRPIGGRSS